MIRVLRRWTMNGETYREQWTADSPFIGDRSRFGESIYKNAFCVELLARKIPFECEKSFVVRYRDRPVGVIDWI